MTQEDSRDEVGPLDESVGYLLKQSAAALRGSMDAVLRPRGLTVPQYACLELLGQRPGLSNSDLARGAFVTRQTMNQILRGLQDRGLVTRPATALQGRSLPTELSDPGRRALTEASAEVAAVERRMLQPLDAATRHQLKHTLTLCIAALGTTTEAGATR